jgi:predicted DNA-binding transcriptional regulator AlpA
LPIGGDTELRDGGKMNERFLDTKAAAEYLGFKPCTLHKWRTTGGGPRFVKFGGAVRYEVPDLEEHIQASKRRTTSEEGG